MNWRWKVFWFKDKLLGKSIKNDYLALKNDYCKFDFKLQKQKLDHLLEIAICNCNFYKGCKKDIKTFPVVNKQIIKDNFDDIFNNNYDKASLHKMTTSGSTGTPFTVFQNREKRDSVIAEIMFFGEIANYKFGERQLFARIWTKVNKKSKLKQMLQNMVPFDISSLNDNNLKSLDHTIIKKRVHCILGYASSLDLYNMYLRKKRKKDRYSIKTIISGSELLNEETRKNLSNYFDCPVFSRYANQENGLLGQDDGYSKKFWLNETNYYFEFLKLDSDVPAKEGELARIVITDLLNYALPMIRYDTGDLCIYSENNHKKWIQEIYGRKRDIVYDTIGNPIEAATISVSFWNIPNVKQFQFIQESKKEYRILLNIDENFCDEQKIIDTFSQLLGKNAKIKVEYVKEIPVLSSGKRKSVVNNYKIK